MQGICVYNYMMRIRVCCATVTTKMHRLMGCFHVCNNKKYDILGKITRMWYKKTSSDKAIPSKNNKYYYFLAEGSQRPRNTIYRMLKVNKILKLQPRDSEEHNLLHLQGCFLH